MTLPFDPPLAPRSTRRSTACATDSLDGPSRDRPDRGPGNDVLLGGGGTDRLSGDLGQDELSTSDAARDLAVGGAGRDRAWSDDVDQVYVEVGMVIAKPIVFQRLDTQDFDSDVWSTNLNGSVLTNLTNDIGLDQGDPALSPFGTCIAYAQEEQDAQGFLVGSDIWVVNIDGSGATNLTPNTPGFDVDPAWSLDGTKIAFTSGPFNGPGVFDAWAVNADGTGLHPLTSDAAVDAYPDWGPDGTPLGGLQWPEQRQRHPDDRLRRDRPDAGHQRIHADSFVDCGARAVGTVRFLRRVIATAPIRVSLSFELLRSRTCLRR